MAQKVVYQLSVRQILLIAFVSAVFAAIGVVCINQFTSRLQPTTSAETTVNDNAPTGISDPKTVSEEQNNIEVYKTVAPGVAFIKTTSYSQDFFGQVEEGRGSGSGSVIDLEGHILTNDHVVEDAQKLTVNLGGDKVYPAKLIGKDPDTDLAVIKVDAPREALTVVPFGDSDALSVGQKVLAIGNPFGLDRTLTTGVISGLQRPIRARNNRPIEGAVQTDASINPGNSGGPLLDSRGRIIGINSQILAPAGGSVGVGFAIPVSIAKRIVPQLIQFGEVRRPKLGVYTRSINELSDQGLNLPIKQGLLIVSITPNSPASQASLRGTTQNDEGDLVLGDIILSIDGEALNGTDDLYKILDKKQIGDTVKVEIYRASGKVTIPVRLTTPPNATQPKTTTQPRRS